MLTFFFIAYTLVEAIDVSPNRKTANTSRSSLPVQHVLILGNEL